MSEMYCPQCGREGELDGDVRFCRYCGFSLGDTKDTIRGYTAVKREGYKFINVSFILAAVLFWVNYFGLIPWNSIWGGNFFLILIFGFIFGLWFMGNWVVDRPGKYVKDRESPPEDILAEPDPQPKELPQSLDEPIAAGDMRVRKTAEMIEISSVTDDTTRPLSNRHPSD